MSIDALKVSPDARAYKGKYVREHDKIKAENARKADYKGFLKSNDIRDLLEELEKERL